MPAPHREQLRAQLTNDGVLKVPGIYDGLSALLVEQAGFPAAFLSGACLSFARFGRPDMGLVSASEVTETIAILRDRVDLPLIIDMDTGFGNALNVQRTVRDFERAGASALQMEDQQMPKRCGHMAGKSVVPCEEMVGKIKAALDARQDDSTVLIARTDALALKGLDDAMDRAEHYLEAGADVLFIEAPQSTEQMQAISERFKGRVPLVHNMVEGGNTPTDSTDELAALGYKIALYPAALLHIFLPAAERVLGTIARDGNTLAERGDMVELKDINALLGADELVAAGKHYGAED